jgi:hypothetical protein
VELIMACADPDSGVGPVPQPAPTADAARWEFRGRRCPRSDCRSHPLVRREPRGSGGRPGRLGIRRVRAGVPDGRFNSAHGYLYAPDGRISPVAADPWAVGTAVDAYIDGLYRPEEARPRAILVQFDRTSGRYQVLFEDTDENRWNATPRTFRQLREELRPRLQ